MSPLTCVVFVAVMLVSAAADPDKDSCSPGRACKELERRVNDKKDAYEKLCDPDTNLPNNCCEDIKKEVERYEDAYDVFCASKQPTQRPTQEMSTPPEPNTPEPTPSPPGPTPSPPGPTPSPPEPTPTPPEPTPTPPEPTTEAEDSCPNPKALGMQSGAIPNFAITASSKYSSKEQPYYGRLMKTGNNYCLWAASLSDHNAWIQINLGEKTIITAVATQGSCNNPKQWVTSYVVRYSEDGKTWTYYNDEQPFPGNKDPSSVVRNEIQTPFEAQYVRIYPKTLNNLFTSIRIELYGCRK